MHNTKAKLGGSRYNTNYRYKTVMNVDTKTKLIVNRKY